jgi:hypothetical protein
MTLLNHSETISGYLKMRNDSFPLEITAKKECDVLDIFLISYPFVTEMIFLISSYRDNILRYPEVLSRGPPSGFAAWHSGPLPSY